jgi:hypothetical protein
MIAPDFIAHPLRHRWSWHSYVLVAIVPPTARNCDGHGAPTAATAGPAWDPR